MCLIGHASIVFIWSYRYKIDMYLNTEWMKSIGHISDRDFDSLKKTQCSDGS